VLYIRIGRDVLWARLEHHVSDRFRLDGRVALVTGGGTGIGRASALVLAEHGADVVLAGRRPEPLEATAKEIEALGRRRIALPTDVTNAEGCRQLVEATLQQFGRVDILVNCAGGAETKSILKWPDDDFERTFALNFNAVWHLSKAVAKPMFAQEKGVIVNISSGASLLAMPQAAPYGAAKAAVNNLTGSMAAAWAKKGIRVNSIAVGAVRAATLTDDAARYGLDPEAIAMSNGLGRLGEPDEIGYGVLFFASDASSFCSGQTLYMHGAPGPAGI
jgi:NAD(P)-dependent dehydrogenase (short-subunit alcohol dehydrogenase family)